MRLAVTSVLFTALAMSSTAAQPTPHSVVIAMNGHVTGQLPKDVRELASLFLPIERKVFEGSYLMVSQWYGVPKKSSTGDPGPVLVPWIRVGPPPPPQSTTPDKERPAIPPGAVTRRSNETVVPLWMHFETAYLAKDARPDKGCPHPVVRMQWKTSSNSGGYMPLSSVSEGVTTGGGPDPNRWTG